jgi:hypothetical protein
MLLAPAWFHAVDLVSRSTWQIKMGWPDIHWLARDNGGLVAAMFEAWVSVESAGGARVGSLYVSWSLPPPAPHCDGVNW